MPIHVSMLGPHEEIFSWADPDGPTLHFAVTQLNAYLQQWSWPTREMQFPSAFDRWLEANRGVDRARSAALTPEDLEVPATVLIMSNGQTLLVDGTHRIHRLYRDGHRRSDCRVVPPQVWASFLISGMRGDMTAREVAALPADNLPHRRR
jgi:hypothetical protein